MKKYIIAPVISMVLACGAITTLAADFTSWQYKLEIKFAGYDREDALTNFPALIVLTDGSNGVDFADFNADGSDLRFSDADGITELNYEIEKWDDADGKSWIWTQVPILTNNTVVYAYWGKSGAIAPDYTTNGATWSQGFAGVWHMGQGAGIRADSTANGFDGSVDASGVEATSTGLIGPADTFSGTASGAPNSTPSSGGVNCGNLSVTGSQTIEMWVHQTDLSRRRNPINKAYGGEGTMTIETDGRINYFYGTVGVDGQPYQMHTAQAGSIPAGEWIHIAHVRDLASARTLHWYINGVQVSATAATYDAATASGNALYIGKGYVYCFNGMLDEIRVSEIAHSAGWIQACYLNQASNTLFNTYGEAELINQNIPRINNADMLSRTDTTADVAGLLLTNGAESAVVRVYWSTTDCSTNAADWLADGGMSELGAYEDMESFTNTIGPLTPNTIYYWNHSASNSFGTTWADSYASPSFKTFGPPAIDNAGGATDVRQTTAYLHGTLTDGVSADITIAVWADGSGSTNLVQFAAPVDEGAFSTNVAGLEPGTLYYYQCYASNLYGASWAAAPPDFTTYPADSTTSDNVTWSGEAGGGLREWCFAANWTNNAAPANPTPGTVFFAIPGQDVDSVLDQDREIYRLTVGSAAEAINHTIDLNNRTLTVTNRLYIYGSGMGVYATAIMENGLLRLGAPDSPATFELRRCLADFSQGGFRLHTENLSLITMADSGWSPAAIIDFRGAEIHGGVFEVDNIEIPGRWCRIYFDETTDFHTLHVKNYLYLTPYVDYNYIGDPANTFSLGGTALGKFPAGVNLKFGVDETTRGAIDIAESRHSSGQKTGLMVNEGGGGEFTAYLTRLQIGYNTTATMIYGILDVSAMDSCLLDTQELLLGIDRETPFATDNINGALRLPPGIAIIGNAEIGGIGVGTAELSMSNTMVTITSSITLNPSASLRIATGLDSRGLDVASGFVDAGGQIESVFLEAPPAATTNWAVRVQGNAVSTLGGMVGSGRLVTDSVYAGKKTGVIYDSGADCTYYALVDDDVPLSLMAIAHDEVTFEKAPGLNVLVDVSEIDNGSYDPDGRPITLTMSVGGGPFLTQLAFNTPGDYTVTLKIQADSDEATDTCIVHIVDLNPGTEDNLTWSGEASTALMNRREWFWSGNWAQGIPPANPTIGTVTFGSSGQDVVSLLDTDRQISALNVYASGFTIEHTLDLGGKTLTIADIFRPGLSQIPTTTLIFTNGTIQLGTETIACAFDARRGTMKMADTGVKWNIVNLDTMTLSDSAYGGATLDLRHAEVTGGVWQAKSLNITGRRGCLYMDSTTIIDTFHILGSTQFQPLTDYSYIGDPADTYSMGGYNMGKLPPGINLVFGVDAENRGLLDIALLRHDSGSRAGIAVAGGGGNSFTAYLTALRIGFNITAYGPTYGMLDISAMDSCLIDTEIIQVGTEREAPLETDNVNGTLKLPPGSVTAGDTTIGGQGAGIALLSTSNTTFIVTSSIAFNKTAQAEFTITSTSSGLDIRNPEPDAFIVADGAALTITFAEPETERPFYGLRWTGSHVDDIQAMIDDGRLVVDNEGLGREISIFTTSGATWLGLPPYDGTAIIFK